MSDLEKIISLIAKYSSVRLDQIKPECDLINDLGMDSLDLFELVVEIEYEFDIDVKCQTFENLRTVGKVIDYIKKAKK